MTEIALMVALGATARVLCAVALGRFIGSMLFELKPADPVRVVLSLPVPCDQPDIFRHAEPLASTRWLHYGMSSCFGYAVSMPEPNAEPVEPAPEPEYSEDGVDLSLIRWTLSLTPAERLEFLDERIRDILTIRALNARE
ncbi:MAG: hypothetical protein ACRD6B_19860 [Bryobacteraceae bacterium]